MKLNLNKNQIAAFDIDAQQTFTPLCPDYCVKITVLPLVRAGFTVILNLAACRGIAPDTVAAALDEMRGAGVVIVSSSAELPDVL